MIGNPHLDSGAPEFRELYTRLHLQLQKYFGTRNDVVLLSASGTGAMEAAVSNLTSPGDRVLVLAAGRYGERWTAICRAFGCEVDLVLAPDGSTFSLDDIKSKVKLETRCVFMQSFESSTGVRHSVGDVSQLLSESESEALLVVDAIASMGSTPLDPQAYSVDALIGASHGFHGLPPGLSFLVLSEKAWDRMEATYNPRYYFDLRKLRRAARNGEAAYTPPTSIIADLSAALDLVLG